MLATLNPNMPVWDQYVLLNAEIEKPQPYSVTINKCVRTYEKVVEFYSKLLDSDESKEMIRLFDEKMPSYNYFTPIKKIDLMLWQKR
jgi:hypothetical protein